MAGTGRTCFRPHFTSSRWVRAARPRASGQYHVSTDEECVARPFLAHNRKRHARGAIPRDEIRTLVKTLGANEAVWYAPNQSFRKKGAGDGTLF